MADHEVTVYSRAACHLCEMALDVIETVVDDVDATVTVEVVDVDTDPELAAAYGERVPYVLVDGRPAFKYRVDPSSLRSTLAAGPAGED